MRVFYLIVAFALTVLSYTVVGAIAGTAVAMVFSFTLCLWMNIEAWGAYFMEAQDDF